MSAEPEEEEGGFDEPTAPAWMATFGDLMSLLLTFFVLLMSFASMDTRRFAAVSGSMRDAFGVQRVHEGQLEALATSIVRFSDVESSPYMRVIDMPRRLVDQEQSLLDRLKRTVVERKLERVVQVDQTPDGVALRVPGQMLFGPGSSALTPRAVVFLREIADVIRDNPGDVAVGGHSDATPGSRGSRANWALSSERAVSALVHLVDVEGVDAKRLRATGFAATRPLTTDPEQQEKNRRVEFLFLRSPLEVELPQEAAADAAKPPAPAG